MSVASGSLSASNSYSEQQSQSPPWLSAQDFPFASRYLALEGNYIHYVDEGEGPTLLFLHANPLWSFQYRKIIAALRGTFRCIALDYPGFGLSTASKEYTTSLANNSALVEKFIDALGIDDIVLVAHDASVSIGLGVATRDPQRFRALVLSNGFAWPLSEDPEVYRFIKIVASPMFGALIVNFNMLARYTTSNLKLSGTEKQAHLGPFAERAQRHHQHDLFRSIVNDRDYLLTLKANLSKLRHLPVLLAFADNDPTYKAGWMQRYEALFPKHKSVRIAGSHHFPQEYNPAAISDAMLVWWKEFNP